MHVFDTTRREFFSRITGSAGLLFPEKASCINLDGYSHLIAPPDVTLRIAPVQLEIAPGRTIKTIGYNGTVPGPLVRFREVSPPRSIL